ncbi:MAG: hypothetical protein ABIA93_00015 [Candidatus Woesearchaeota archaeon]
MAAAVSLGAGLLLLELTTHLALYTQNKEMTRTTPQVLSTAPQVLTYETEKEKVVTITFTGVPTNGAEALNVNVYRHTASDGDVGYFVRTYGPITRARTFDGPNDLGGVIPDSTLDAILHWLSVADSVENSRPRR